MIFSISVSTPTRTKALVPTLRVGTVLVPLRGALDVSQRNLFPSRSLTIFFQIVATNPALRHITHRNSKHHEPRRI